ncbi:methyltransferase-domain-containing protein [Biscogniauxia marginata]|nr:methyltransferase-domain-containing protein [Biscogniauxia marginata]
MFAVPGWAVSAGSLKAETAVKQSPGQSEPSNSKKRKRPSLPTNVTASNVADLWEQVIEGRSGKKSKSGQDDVLAAAAAREGGRKGLTLKEKKRLKKLKTQEESQGSGEPGQQRQRDGGLVQGADKQTTESTDVGDPGKESKKKDKKRKKTRDQNSSEGAVEGDDPAGGEAQAATASTPAPGPTPAAAPKLTPLQAAMREKLVSARFRHLNETLYTKPSADAFRLFEDSPEMFREYHEGFRRQVDVWPENPVDGYIEDIRRRGAERTTAPRRDHHHHDQKSRRGGADADTGTGTGPLPPSDTSIQPLPRTGGVCTIADLGCGDAKLASALQPDRRRLNLRLLSYDLQSPHPLVTRADAADLPLAAARVDVAVFCLALMGTNWLDFVNEAYRVLRWKGELWVAEIKSRFGPPPAPRNKQQGRSGVGAAGQNAPVAHSVGNRRKIPGAAAVGEGGEGKKRKTKSKGRGKDAEEDDEADLAVVVDGAEDKRQETDVSAFVEALRKRGFLLQQNGGGAAAVDLRNKMFVKMRFIKAATPTVGKGAVAAKEAGREGARGSGGMRKNNSNAVKFIEATEEQNAVDENSILKPCVYKIR